MGRGVVADRENHDEEYHGRVCLLLHLPQVPIQSTKIAYQKFRLFQNKLKEEDYEAKNFQLKNNLYILQNCLTMDQLGIPKCYQVPSLLNLCITSTQKILS